MRPILHPGRAQLIDDVALFHQLCMRATLDPAWRKVLSNGGAAGGDHVSVERFLARAEGCLTRLAESLTDGSYRPGPLRAVEIPKRRGGVRTLHIPCVVDRIAQTAAANLLSPLLDAEFEEASFGYRPGRGVAQAVARIQSLHGSGFSHVVEADIDDYFDTIPHDALIARLGESMAHGPLTELIVLWLSCAAPQGRGVAQGSPLSPLLANLYLDRLDEAFSRDGARIIRFADDFVILTGNCPDADAALLRVQRLLQSQGLTLDRDKTRVTDFDRGFRFLGHLFVRSLAMKVAPEEADDFSAERALAEIARRDADEGARARQNDADVEDQEARGYSPGLHNLYVLGEGRRLSLRNQAFSVEECSAGVSEETPVWHELVVVPHQQIDRIDLGPRAGFTPAALDQALAAGVPVAFLDGHGATRGWLSGTLTPRAGRHLAQARTALDAEKRLALACTIILSRLKNQRNILRKLCLHREPIPGAVTDAIARLSDTIGHGGASTLQAAESCDHLMGYEGAASAVYWRAISALCHSDFLFPARKRYPRPDPANIALNMLCWLLHRDVSAAVGAAGLHPGFGALHGISDHHDGCVYDLMEEFRAHMVEGLFVYITNRRILRGDMFVADGPGWRLARGGGDALIRAYEARATACVAWPHKGRKVAVRRVMIEQAHALARHHENDGGYRPFEVDY